jgi:hypothetical protein
MVKLRDMHDYKEEWYRKIILFLKFQYCYYKSVVYNLKY